MEAWINGLYINNTYLCSSKFGITILLTLNNDTYEVEKRNKMTKKYIIAIVTYNVISIILVLVGSALYITN